MSCNPYHAHHIGAARIRKDSEASKAPTTTTTTTTTVFIPQPIFQKPKYNITVSIANVPEAVKNMIKFNLEEVVRTSMGN